jgi:hypothetical protein
MLFLVSPLLSDPLIFVSHFAIRDFFFFTITWGVAVCSLVYVPSFATSVLLIFLLH